MKANRFTLTLVVLGLTASNLAFAQGGPSTLHAPPAAVQYLPYGVSTPLLTGVTANGTAFDYRNDRKRVAHFWKTYNHRLVPVLRGQDVIYGGAYTSTFWNIASNGTGDVATCSAGTVSLGIQEAAIRQSNWYRAMIGVLPVVNGSEATRAVAQQAALVNKSGEKFALGLSHTPGPNYPCYSVQTAAAAGRSNLAVTIGKNQLGPGAVDLFIDDAGTNNAKTGHRFSLLDPGATGTAYGAVSAPFLSGTILTEAGIVGMPLEFGSNYSSRDNGADLLWPSAGFVPVQAYPSISNRWSFSCINCDTSAATVKILRNGAEAGAGIESRDGNNRLVWTIQGVDYRSGLNSGAGYPVQDDVFDVTITYRKNGQPAIKTYRTTVFNPEVDTDFVPTFDVTDLYWVPTESGWGAKLVQATDGSVFGAVYFYDETGNPRWMTIQGSWTAPGVFSGKLYTTRGPGFNASPFNPASVQVTEAGTATLTFAADTQSVRFDFAMGNQVASKQMVRFSNIPEGYRDGSNYRGLWWNANESGWGLTMQHYYNSLFVAWFTYNPDGSQVWVTLQGSWTSATTYEGKLYQVKQAPWNPASFDANATQVTEVGMAKLTFTDVNRAAFDYTMKNVTGKKLIEKFEF